MARAWLRGVEPQNYANNSTDDWTYTPREHNSIIYHFLTKCLNYTLIDEVISGTGQFDGNEQASDTDGSFDGTSYQLTISSSKFTAGMVGEFIVLKDPANEENSGVYLIESYIDANNITINFYTTAGTYPTSGSGISWWVLTLANMPYKYGSYVILESPHATNKYTMQLMYQSHTNPNSGDFSGGSQKPGFGVMVVPGPASENWDDVGHTWTSLATDTRKPGRKFTIPRGRVDDPDHNRIFGFGHDDGSYLALYSKHDAGAGYLHGFMCGVVELFETTPVHDAKDYIVTSGPWHGIAYSVQMDRGLSSDDMDRTEVWSSADYSTHNGSWQDWHNAGTNNRLFEINLTGPNEYTGEYDGLPIFIMVDPYDDEGAISLHGQWNPLHVCYTTARHLGELVTFDSDRWINLRHSVAIPWPGLPTYF